jgi:hypothetical protein
MKAKLTANRTILLRLTAECDSSEEQERATERDLDAALDSTLDEIREFAARKLVEHGVLCVKTY